MAAMVQTYPQQTGTVTMLQTRPTSNSGVMPSGQTHSSHQYITPSSQTPRSTTYHAMGPTGYRGSSVPVQPYAFTSTPSLNQPLPWQQPYGAYRTNSSPVVPVATSYDPNIGYRIRHHNNSSPNLGYMHHAGVGQNGSRDDFALPLNRSVVSSSRPHSGNFTGSSPQPPPSFGATPKVVPDRYRRQGAHAAQHTRSQSMTLPPNTVGGNSDQVYGGSNNLKIALPARPNSFYGAYSGTSLDDIHLSGRPLYDESKRVQRRSMPALDSPDSRLVGSDHGKKEELSLADTLSVGSSSDKNSKMRLSVARNAQPHSRNGSTESVSSSRSSHSRPSSATNRNAPVPTGNPSLRASDGTLHGKHDNGTSLNIPTRGSSSDATKRTLSPSPLSKPATMGNGTAEASVPAASSAATANLDTPAAKQLAALNQKDGKAKGKTSRLRRAFSFGSAAELRKAAGGDRDTTGKAEPVRLHKEPTADEAYDAEQARIAEAQEAAGIGNNIYGSRFFGSTDNLSISSTASSASIMLRKMGRGMKKGGRSLAGLFRPKSVIGVPPAEPFAAEATQAAVSMITVEAERQRVNVTAEPQGSSGGTGFPHLERNSMDASQVPEMIVERIGSSGTDNSSPRKSIVGGDRERAEVLAAVRKGILKRSGSASPSKQRADMSPELELPAVPAITESPNSSAPSTPKDELHGHKRTGSIAIGNEDYFMSALRLRQDTKSAPGTPQGTKRNATFSPRIVFHDTWPSQEYDRRGEIATCNRLTPMLAQQIKEELNTFKMEMEVHENSKIYTHFF